MHLSLFSFFCCLLLPSLLVIAAICPLRDALLFALIMPHYLCFFLLCSPSFLQLSQVPLELCLPTLVLTSDFFLRVLCSVPPYHRSSSSSCAVFLCCQILLLCLHAHLFLLLLFFCPFHGLVRLAPPVLSPSDETIITSSCFFPSSRASMTIFLTSSLGSVVWRYEPPASSTILRAHLVLSLVFP